MSASQGAKKVAIRAGNSRTFTGIARAGYGAIGLIHVLMGLIAIRVAFHRGGESDQSGAFAQLVKLPGGALLIWATAIGLAALAVWMLIQAGLGVALNPASAKRSRFMRSMPPLGKGATYLAMAFTALSFALQRPTSSSVSSKHASGTVLSWPAGQLLLVVAGLVTVGVGCFFVYKGAWRKFVPEINVSDGGAGKAVTVLGALGFIAKGVAIMSLGALIVVAALNVDPNDASGLDGALRRLTMLPFGETILILVGFGFIAYGLYNFALIRVARL